MELAGIGVTASIELYRATGNRKYADKAVELARLIVASQQQRRVGREFPVAGFFYTGPDRDTLFHQFHRGNDQAPIVALAQLVDALPDHADWMTWYATVARYAEYQKRAATTTAPYGVLPSYVYRVGDEAKEVPDSGALHGATREAYRAQVMQGMPMGDGWYLRAFPVWFARRGNYGPLLSQAKALAVAARLRGDSAGLDLAQRQAQWIVGRNPFVQSTMYGEGYDWSQQYSVSAVGARPRHCERVARGDDRRLRCARRALAERRGWAGQRCREARVRARRAHGQRASPAQRCAGAAAARGLTTGVIPSGAFGAPLGMTKAVTSPPSRRRSLGDRPDRPRHP
jgi:hypothetical protein